MTFIADSDRADGYVSVADFGAAGDGASDDTAAVRAAIKAARDTKSKTVFFPDGLYLITDAVEIPAGISVAGVTAATCGPWQNVMDAADKGVLYKGLSLDGNYYNPDMYKGSWILCANGIGDAGDDATFMLRGGNNVSMIGFVNASVTPMTSDGSITEAPPVIGVKLEELSSADGITISDISLANCWYGIAVWQGGLTDAEKDSNLSAYTAGGIRISDIMGSPMYTGISIRGVSDTVTLQNLQFNYASYGAEYVAQRASYARDVVIAASGDVTLDGMLSFGARTGVLTEDAFSGAGGKPDRVEPQS